MRSMLQAWIFFILLTAHLIISVPANATQTFEQAYAPIDVSGITIFIPIELIPEPPTELIIATTANDYQLEWSAVPGATRYIIEYKNSHNGQWTVHNANVTSTSFSIPISLGATEFRVITCQQYGCSAGKSVDNDEDIPLQIKVFATSKQQLNQGEYVTLNWNIVGATQVQLTSSKGLTSNSLPLTGSTSVTTEDLTNFTLTATGFDKQTQQQLSIVKAAPSLSLTEPTESIYLQPLYALGLQPIERSLYTGHNRTSYVATYDKKLYQVADTANGNWERVINLPGLMANKPLLLTNPATSDEYLFFALSMPPQDGQNVRGKVCRLTLTNSALNCVDIPNNAIASPILFQQRLFQVDVNGIIYEFSPFDDFSTYIHSEPLEEGNNSLRVLTTPQVDLSTGAIIVRSNNELKYFSLLDIAASPQSFSNMFSEKSTKHRATKKSGMQAAPTTNSTPAKKTSLVWSKKLD